MPETTIYRCDCGRKHLDHELVDGTRCSFGGCSCTKSRPTVEREGERATVPTFPGYDSATGKWATR